MNHKIKITKNGDFLYPETFQQGKRVNITLDILSDAQHDGKAWTRDYIEDSEYDLLTDIMGELEDLIRAFIREANPFAIHDCGGPSVGEIWTVGAYLDLTYVGVGLNFAQEKALIFQEKDGTYFFISKDEFWHSSLKKVRQV
jgi:hypothetical protein